MTKMFNPTGCTCSTDDEMRAALEGKERLCPVHDAALIRQRALDRVEYERETELARLHEVYQGIKAEMTGTQVAECTCQELAVAVAGHLSGNPPAPCPVHDPVQPDTSSVALNDDDALAAAMGLPLSRTTGLPPDAV